MQRLLRNRRRKVQVECVQGGKPGKKTLHVDIQRRSNSSLIKVHFCRVGLDFFFKSSCGWVKTKLKLPVGLDVNHRHRNKNDRTS